MDEVPCNRIVAEDRQITIFHDMKADLWGTPEHRDESPSPQRAAGGTTASVVADGERGWREFGEPIWVVGVRAWCTGAFAAGSFLYGHSMLVDTFAWDFKLTGVRREGMLSAGFRFGEKASLALGPLIIGTLLSAMGFDKTLPPDADQSPSAVQAMYLGFVGIPVACQLLSAGLLYFYHLDESDLAAEA